MIKKTITENSTTQEMGIILGDKLKKIIGSCVDKTMVSIVQQLEEEVNLIKMEELASEVRIEQLEGALKEIQTYPIDRPIQAIIKKALK